jgi:kinase suppressor of Ras 2
VDEWSIPYDSIRIGETIGRGRVSRVSRGNWHGDVASKHFYMPNATKDQVIKFKEEVSILKKTRHENLVLFMGASLVPPNLAIVTM